MTAQFDMYLTDGELLRTYRRRMGLRQQEFAGRLGITTRKLSFYENDLEAVPAAFLPKEEMRLTLGEAAYILRCRKGLTIDEAAARLGVSRVTVIKAESGIRQNVALRLIEEYRRKNAA